ncbi:MAG: hypothetical protein M1537_08875 [Nitrospirae bacterium]|nr:hypothetical protein [Nitrospirota bacterium]MCL5286091.1 hypothetical protein [Nitrospirota bacterium]
MIKEYIKKVGTGPHGVRDLERTEAAEAARLLLSGTATPAQTGALLLGLRLKGETGEEMGGFLDTLRALLPPPPLPSRIDLDIGDPYDGKRRSMSLVVPASLAAARSGLSIVLHGLSKVPVKQGPGVVDVWRSLGRPLSTPEDGKNPDGKESVRCLSQESFLPALARLLPLRQELGLRTLWNTVEKCVNPLKASAQIIGIFHEPVIEKLRLAMETKDDGRPRRILFVCGSEGGVDLHTHRSTLCYLLDPLRGPELHPVTIPPPPDNPGALPPPEENSGSLPFLREIVSDPSHPMSLHLKRQTALFLFASGRFSSFPEAEASLLPETFQELKETFSLPRSHS